MRSSRRRSSVRRQVGATVALLLISGVAIAGWVVGSRVRSPEMAAANAAPPDPSLITAPVELRVLSSQVVERGDVVPGQSAAVYGPSSESATTVTAVLVEVGDELAEGNPIVEVSGRPVVVFEGPVPAFRDMRPGMSGADVDELQAALARVGCDPSADDGVYGEETKRCVEVLYGALGYPIVPTSDTEATDLAEARDAVAEAEDQLTTAQAALDEKQAGPDDSDVVTAQVALDAAIRKVTDTAASGDKARAEAAAAVDAAVLKLNAELADRTSTPAERADARAALAAAVLDADAADREATEADLGAAEGVQTAQAELDDLNAPPDVDAETLAVEQAQGSLDRATEALVNLEARSGAIVPRGEIVFLDVLPATVISLAARVGAPIDSGDGSNGALAVLATAGLRVESLVSPSDVELLTAGMDVELRDDISGDSLPATLTTLGDQVVTSDDGNDRGFRAIIETTDPIPREWTGRNVRVTFTGAETATAVLVVPVSALSSSADGEARVEVVGGDGIVTAVPVEAGLSAEGFVEVTPLADATLKEGDLVIVGSNGGGADS